MADAADGLVTLLDSLGESSEFAAYGSLAPVLPGLEMEGVGTVGMPVSVADARQLIAQAAQAPYGRGEETIVDTDVRRVWQLEPSHFTLRNAQWQDHMSAIVDAVKQQLGIDDTVRAELYKLLVYEQGSFFAPHRDTEKIPGMFATLVVSLPSRHEGGRLIVRHDGQTREIDFAGPDAEFKTKYAAFYADCQHEIEPVTAGYRICLVYNLAVAKKKKQPSAPRSSQAVDTAAQLLKEWFFQPTNVADKIVIPFTHQYTEVGLSPQQLKGADRARGDVLSRAAESLGYHCYIALLTHWQSGGVDYSTWDFDDSWGSRRYRSSRRPVSAVRMDEVYDEKMSLDHWLDVHGQPQPFGQIHLEEGEVLGGSEGWSYEQEVHEATGNEGATLERWYRRAVVVIWPPDRFFSILAGEGQAAALPELERMAAQAKKAVAQESCRRLAEQIIAGWEPRQVAAKGQPRYTARMLSVLERVGTAELVGRFLQEVLRKGFDGSEGAALWRLCERFGWQRFAADLRSVVAEQTPSASYSSEFTELPQIVALCRPLYSDPPPLTAERRAVCDGLADELVRAIERWDDDKTDRYGSEHTRGGVVEGMVAIFSAVDANERLDWFVAYVLEDAKHYGLRKVLVPDVKVIYCWLAEVPAARPAAERLMEHCTARLRALTEQAPEPPKDWRREAELKCKCEDCRELIRFLRDPSAQVGRFPLRKDRRQHLHQQIDHHRLDCTHETERKGSPQTLVCTKTQASFERKLNQYQQDRQMLAELETLVVGKAASADRRKPSRRTLKK